MDQMFRNESPNLSAFQRIPMMAVTRKRDLDVARY